MNSITMTVSEQELPRVVDYLAQLCKSNHIIGFRGALGAGKTTIIKQLLRHYGVTDTVQSPTYTFVNRYTNVQGQVFYHFDLYRMKNMTDFEMAGFDEYLENEQAISFIEWPEIIEPLLGKKACFVSIVFADFDRRKITILMPN